MRIEGAVDAAGSVRSITIAAGRVVTTPHEEARVIDAAGLTAVPGLVDLQVNGAGGVDLSEEPEGLWDVAKMLPRFGVTSFLPTLLSPSPVLAERALAILAAGPPAGFAGARPLGWHFEGPFLAPGRRGAHPAGAIAAPSMDAIRGWSAASGVVVVTLAPEVPGAIPLIGELVARGVVVAAGHSDATAGQARTAAHVGLGAVTHLFNAMSGVHHREPGLAAAVLAGLDVTSMLIADGVHVSPEALRLAWRSIAPARRVIVSDAVAALGAAAGGYTLAGQPVLSDGTVVRGTGGGLAGSAAGLDSGLRTLVAVTGCALAEVVAAATANPAALLGRDDVGTLDPGAHGDVVLFDDALEVVATIVGGAVAYRREG